jgi:excinuclease ABC subunit A
MALDQLVVRGAREHNLKNITVALPRNALVVITGLSGSGKSSLAFDTIYAEGQRRYVESLSAYARQFLGQMEKPDVDQIEGLSPAISIDQKSGSHNPRSTVGTVTEIYDYLRLLYARIGIPHCPNCGQAIARQTPDQIADAILALADGTRILLLAPLVRDRKGAHEKVFEDLRKAGFVRARVDGTLREIEDDAAVAALDRYKNHTIEAVVDRLVVRHGEDGLDRTRLADSVETALELGDGVLVVAVLGAAEGASSDILFSEHFACPQCGISLPAIEPRSFSFNSPHGACSHCQGLGIQRQVDPALVVPNPDLSLRDGAVAAWTHQRNEEGYYGQILAAVSETFGFDMATPWRELPAAAQAVVLHGAGEQPIEVHYRTRDGRRRQYRTQYEGVVANLTRRYESTDSEYVRTEIEKFMTERPCAVCQGGRLRPEMAAVTVVDRNIIEVGRMTTREAQAWIASLDGSNGRAALTERERLIGAEILKEIRQRLGFLVDVGLDYLTIARRASSLSGGEAQRIRLATQIGSQLMGVLYVLDEPSIGLHPRDNARLIRTLLGLRDVGNTVLVVEHDEETIRSADWIVDMGPGAGRHGGYVVAEGTVADIEAHAESLTGQYISGRRHVPVPAIRRTGNGRCLAVYGARANNLKSIDVDFPLGTLTVITGVSGSGKSSLVLDVLYARLAQLLSDARSPAGPHDRLTGYEHVDKVIDIDQSPIGRTPRSNPATYTGLFGPIRDLFAALPDAKLRGYKPGRFSFNVKGGRCEACAGDGILRIEMQFLPDVYVPCEVCHGARYNRETLQIKFKGLSISEILDLTISEAADFFVHMPAIHRKLSTLVAVGLGYLQLGQPAPTLSGGEAQRVKLARELSRVATGNTLYILDEPTTGLHFADVERLLAVLQALVDAGNTVLVIEHNLDIIKAADWIIDLGPDGGERGGMVVAVGTPERVMSHPTSHTGAFLAKVLHGKWTPDPIRS